MILIHIVTKSEEQATEIVDFLIEKKFILNALIMDRVSTREKKENGLFQTKDQYLIIGKTRALLFDTIDKEIREKFKQDIPEIYSLPIVNMDWDQANALMNETINI